MDKEEIWFTIIDECAGFIGRIRNLTSVQSKIIAQRYGDHVDSVDELAARLRLPRSRIEGEMILLSRRLRGPSTRKR